MDISSCKSIWCLVADLCEDPIELVYCFPPLWSGWGKKLRVLRYNSNGSIYSMVMKTERLTNWRVQLITEPKIIKNFWEAWGGEEESRKQAFEMAGELTDQEDRRLLL